MAFLENDIGQKLTYAVEETCSTWRGMWHGVLYDMRSEAFRRIRLHIAEADISTCSVGSWLVVGVTVSIIMSFGSSVEVLFARLAWSLAGRVRR